MFAACFIKWLAGLCADCTDRNSGPEVVAIDSKTSCRIHDRAHDRGGDNLLAVKENWPNVHAEIGRAFDDPAAIGLLRLGTTDGNCGRIELRRHTVCHDMAAIRHIA